MASFGQWLTDQSADLNVRVRAEFMGASPRPRAGRVLHRQGGARTKGV